MKRKILFVISMSMILCLLGCTTVSNNDENNSKIDNIETIEQETNESDENYSGAETDIEEKEQDNVASSKNSIEHYCEECSREGTYSIVGISGRTEYYCYSHYKEMQDTLSKMEEKVGQSSASKHKCEQCSKEGTYSIKGISGRTEYYCSRHYNQMIETLEKLLGE